MLVRAGLVAWSDRECPPWIIWCQLSLLGTYQQIPPPCVARSRTSTSPRGGDLGRYPQRVRRRVNCAGGTTARPLNPHPAHAAAGARSRALHGASGVLSHAAPALPPPSPPPPVVSDTSLHLT